MAELVARLRAETGDFTRGMGRARESVAELDQRIANSSNRWQVFGQRATQALSAVGLGLAGVTTSVVMTGLSMNTMLETTTLQFATLMKDADRAKKHVAGLFDFAAKTPFETGPIIEASRLLQTFGGDALNTADNLTIIGDAAAAASADIGRVAFYVGRAFNAIKSGRAPGEAMMYLQEMSVVSGDARNKIEALTKAGADWQTVWKALQDDIGRFNGAMVKQAETFNGLKSTLIDLFKLNVAKMFLPTFEGLKKVMKAIVELFNQPVFERYVGNATKLFEEVGKVAERLAVYIDGLSSRVGRASAVGDRAVEVWNRVKTAIEPLLPVIGLLTLKFSQMGFSMLPIVGRFAEIMPLPGLLTTALIGLLLSSAETRAAIKDMGEQILAAAQTHLPPLVEALSKVIVAASGLLPPILEIISAFIGVLPVIAQTVSAVATGLVPVLKTLAGVLTPLARLLADHEELVLALAAAYLVFKTRAAVAATVTALTTAFRLLNVTIGGVIATQAGWDAAAARNVRGMKAMATVGRALNGVLIALTAGFAIYTSAASASKKQSEEMMASLQKGMDLSSLEGASSALTKLNAKILDNNKSLADLSAEWDKASIMGKAKMVLPWNAYDRNKRKLGLAEEQVALDKFGKEAILTARHAYTRVYAAVGAMSGVTRQQIDAMAETLNINIGTANAEDSIVRLTAGFAKAKAEAGGIAPAIAAATKQAENLEAKVKEMQALSGRARGVFDFEPSRLTFASLDRVLATLPSHLTPIHDQLENATRGVEAFEAASASLAEILRKDSITAITELLNRVDPYLAKSFTVAYAEMRQLSLTANDLNLELITQTATLDQLQAALDAANTRYIKVEAELRSITDEISRLMDEVNRPLQGSEFFSDAKFAIDQELKATRLALLQVKRAAGGIDTGQVQALEERLAELQIASQEIDLQEALALEPLQREIAKTVDDSREITFSEALNAAKNVAELRDRQSEVNAELGRAREQVDLTKTKYDEQKTVVDNLAAAYGAVKERIGELSGAISGFVDHAKTKFGDLITALQTSIGAMQAEVAAAAPGMTAAGAALGGYLGTGIANGLDYWKKYWADTLGIGLDEAMAFVAGKYQIYSPSGWTRDHIGKPLAEGISLGLGDAGPGIQASIERLLGQMARATAGVQLPAPMMEALIPPYDPFAPSRDAVARVLGSLPTPASPLSSFMAPGSPTNFGTQTYGSGITVTVMNEGSVVTSGDLTEQIRHALLDLKRRNGGAGFDD